MKKGKINWKLLILSLVIVYAAAFIGSLLMSDSSSSDWYQSIKPSITPPSYIFPIVWNILFFLIAISFYLILNQKFKSKNKLISLFILNFILNILWTLFYFRMQNPLLALIDILFLWVSILLLVIFTYKISKTSSYFLMPYLVWVSFAIILNSLSIK